MKKQTLRYTVLSLLTFLSTCLYLFANTNLPQDECPKKSLDLNTEVEADHSLAYLNQLRLGAGLIPLTENISLGLAAQNHADYLIKNKKIGHYEEAKYRGYTGEYGSNRAIQTGYKTPMIIENVSSNNLNYQESIDGLMGAIYHRFGFLDFHIDEIGIGVHQDPNNPYQTAFVYDMGNQALNNLCTTPQQTQDKKPLVKVCANPKITFSKKRFFNAINSNSKLNHPLITYPYNGQSDIPPAFYEELPDPLPEHSVSGFPISVSFDESHFKSIEMLSFKLYDSTGKELTDTLQYNQQTDPNHKLKKFEFALFPLQRLAWNHTYKVKIQYKADKKREEKTWYFKTRTFQEPLHAVTAKHHHFKLIKGEAAIFYFPPHSPHDILPSLRYPASLDINFVDKNTIKITAKQAFKNRLILHIGSHQLSLDIINP